ncbi:MAG: hypothetical protein ABEJ72_06180 [Candidatus Aenigmatarchaeota archaeon]
MQDGDMILRRKVLDSSGKVVLPEEVRTQVETEDFVKGEGTRPSVQWGYETNSGVLILSQESLEKPNYESLMRSVVYEEGSNGSVTYKIRPSSKLEEEITGVRLSNGDEIYYYADEKMISEDNENSSVYFLTKPQMYRILSRDNLPEEEEELKQVVLDTPGFLPSI